MKYFITGHTGFKGAWLSVMLSELGHELHGYSLDPQPDSLFTTAEISRLYKTDIRDDIRHEAALQKALTQVNPDIVIHLAAQALVREGYRKPKETFETNFNGTLNLLSSLSLLSGLKAALIITTDKVYADSDNSAGCEETDPLGGLDPYSASKAAADILSQSWAYSNPNLPIAIARAGNVIGGGDRSVDRLLPDLIQAFSSGITAQVRNPKSVRPWQHVMDCLSGYLLLIDSITSDKTRGAWNFGPQAKDHLHVEEIVDLVAKFWGPNASWSLQPETNELSESPTLLLNVDKAREKLAFSTRFSAREAVESTVKWELAVTNGSDAMDVTRRQVIDYFRVI
jgi:CDP-glucose 4,6-dehydratase